MTTKTTPKFDPSKPVSIHNPWPLEKWPIKKGRKVYFIWDGIIHTGTVRFYNPARKQDEGMIVTAGKPFYTVQLLENGWSNPISADWVRSFTKGGLEEIKKSAMAESKRRLESHKESLRAEERHHLGYLAELADLKHPHPQQHRYE